MSALTAKQRELLEYIRLYQLLNKRSPSFEEMREALGLKAKSGIHRLLTALDERGFIRRLHNKARCIELVDQPTLPSAGLQAAPIHDLMGEMRRRGFVIGHYQRRFYTGTKGEKHSYKHFVELSA